MKRMLICGFVCLLFSGCFLYDCGYTRNDDVNTYHVTHSDKIAVTYSIDFDTCYPWDAVGSPTKKSIKDKIEESLKDTSIFSSVNYGDKDDLGYHIAFRYRDSGYVADVAMAKVVVYCYTLFMFPITEDYSCDLFATVYLKGVPIWSTAHTEKCRYVVCWYALPAGIVMNYWSVWRSIEYNLVNSVVNDFASEHIRRFIDGTHE